MAFQMWTYGERSGQYEGFRRTFFKLFQSISWFMKVGIVWLRISWLPWLIWLLCTKSSESCNMTIIVYDSFCFKAYHMHDNTSSSQSTVNSVLWMIEFFAHTWANTIFMQDWRLAKGESIWLNEGRRPVSWWNLWKEILLFWQTYFL